MRETTSLRLTVAAFTHPTLQWRRPTSSFPLAKRLSRD